MTFEELEKINSKPEIWGHYTAGELWTNEHTANCMLECHLNEEIDLSSRNHAFIDRSVKWMIDQFNIDAKSFVADFGCGPGLYTTRLAKQGANVTGIDFSENSLNYAKKVAAEKALAINYIHADYLEYDADEQYDLITMIMCDFCALSPEQRQQMLRKFHKLLKPNGVLLFDVYSLNSFNQKVESANYELNQLNGFWAANDYYCFMNSFKYEEEKVSLDKYTIVERNRTRVVYNWLQHFSKELLKQELECSGFLIKGYFSNIAGDCYDSDSLEFAVVANKN